MDDGFTCVLKGRQLAISVNGRLQLYSLTLNVNNSNELKIFGRSKLVDLDHRSRMAIDLVNTRLLVLVD